MCLIRCFQSILLRYKDWEMSWFILLLDSQGLVWAVWPNWRIVLFYELSWDSDFQRDQSRACEERWTNATSSVSTSVQEPGVPKEVGWILQVGNTFNSHGKTLTSNGGFSHGVYAHECNARAPLLAVCLVHIFPWNGKIIELEGRLCHFGVHPLSEIYRVGRASPW